MRQGRTSTLARLRCLVNLGPSRAPGLLFRHLMPPANHLGNVRGEAIDKQRQSIVENFCKKYEPLIAAPFFAISQGCSIDCLIDDVAIQACGRNKCIRIPVD